MRFNKNALLLPALVIIMSASTALAAPTLSTGSGSNQSQGLNVEISPLPIQLDVKPGATTTADLRVRNSGSTDETLKVTLKTFSAEGPDGHIVLHDLTPADEFAKWVSFDRSTFLAPAGQWQTIRMTVSPPKSAAFGYYYAVQIQLANPPKAQPGATRLQGAVAIFVLLNVDSPGASRQIKVQDFKASHSSYEFLPVDFSVTVRNVGNVHTAPHGNIFIKRGGKQVASLEVNSAEGMVLPRSNRVFNASWSDGFPSYITTTDNSGNTKKHLQWDFSKVSKLRFGHYTAQLLLVYNDGQRDVPITGTLSFWVVPWRIIGIILAIILLIIGLAMYVIILRRRLKRQAQPGKRGSSDA